MDVPMLWLKEYTDVTADIKQFIEDITLTGSKVEGYTTIGGDIENVVTGQIKKIVKHQDADKLVITTVDVGKQRELQIVTGATNLKEGDYVPVALDNSKIANGVEIHSGSLRGILSEGMLCSIQELGFDLHDFPEACENGIYVFPEAVELGKNVVDVLDLKDDVVEFEITSNRPDCFSILGIAREAAATYQIPFKYPKIEVQQKAGGNASDYISVEIKNPQLCPRYAARVVKNVKIEPSPLWMRKRLRAAGVRPINNIVDITNYVMIEMGQPMHAFDIDCIAERKIIVRNANDGEQITTLDGNVRNLDSSMLVISDPQKAVAVAGVMGGENSKINENAEAILFESATFHGSNIRVTAKKLGLRTDASSKYEKGLDPNIALEAVNRAAQLVEMLGAGEVVEGIVDCYPNKRESWTLSYSPEKINKLLGTNVSEQQMKEIFERIELKVDEKNHTVVVPTFRPDLEAQADLAEEVARFYGYDKIEPTLAAGTHTVGKRSRSQIITAMVKQNMISSGLCEAMTFSFESPKVFDKLNIAKDSNLRKTVTISNPLGEDYSIMRTTTLNAILTSLATNYNRRNESAGLFEIAKVYLPKAVPVVELPDEISTLTIGMYGNMDFYDIKGIVEKMFEVLGMSEKVEYATEKNIAHMHTGRTASICVENKQFGYVGELHPQIASNYGIGTKVYIAVINMPEVIAYADLVKEYKALPKFPAVTRDIAMVVSEDVTVKQIENVIKQNAGQYLESVKLFDVYQGKQIGKGLKSVAYSITFRAADKTLVEQDVTEAMKQILEHLSSQLQAQLRDK